ncbi:MAG TPA: hypothetical protein VFW28_08465 [Micropepsaceae bacterium]|nr:hypothetical protein [Micropepsaceae bacterium]
MIPFSLFAPRSSLLFLALIALCAACPAQAETDPATALLGGTTLIDLRLRFEDVDVKTKTRRAWAATLRARIGFQTGNYDGFSAVVEGDFIGHLDSGHYNDTLNGRVQFPTIADPDMAALNRLQVNYAAALTPAAKVSGRNDLGLTAGRQRIMLGDQRFIGNAGWRQHEQTYDGLAIVDTSIPATTLTYAWIGGVNRVFGPDSPMGRFDSNSHLLNAAYAGFGPGLQIEAYDYLLDFRQAPLLSTATYGAHVTSTLSLAPDLTGHVAGAYARQTPYGPNPLPFDLGYDLAEAGLSYAGLTGTAGYEVLGGNGRSGFSTPLASLHLFQGWAEQFVSTPPDGVRDLYGRAQYAFPLPMISANAAATVAYHSFHADHTGIAYGTEWDGSLDVLFRNGTMLGAAFGDFLARGGGFASKSVFWLYAGYHY